MPHCPALFIGAPASGQGKTSIVAGLARLHARQGRRVKIFKCGPDFLDPMIHAFASGSPCENLDLWMCGEEIADLDARLERMADHLAQTPLAVLPAPTLAIKPQSPPLPQLLAGRRIAIARDAAFAFIYPANLECLAALGAELRFFAPLNGDVLPDCDALWLPGGYPELHAEALSLRTDLHARLHAHANSGKPLLAECGGMMALFETLVDQQGRRHTMSGLLPGSASMQQRLAALGAQQADLPEGPLRGHTFHYSQADTPLPPLLHARRHRGGELQDGGEAIYRRNRLTASYLHFYFPSNPAAAAALFLP